MLLFISFKDHNYYYIFFLKINKFVSLEYVFLSLSDLWLLGDSKHLAIHVTISNALLNIMHYSIQDL